MDCQILKMLGEGSFGTVYLVEVPQKGLFALKSSTASQSSSLRREYKILRQFIGCEEIIQCYDIEFHYAHQINLLLEFAEGGSLGDYMRKHFKTPMPEFMVRSFTRKLLRGLSLLHKKGIVHADIKPDNILMFPTEDCFVFRIKISDFGLSKMAGEEKKYDSGRFYATPNYMSPESVNVGEIEPPLDIWSLGCTVMEMLIGKPAWDVRDKDELFFALVTERSPEIPEDMSENAKDFLRKCFEMDPKTRWTADMLLDHPFVDALYESL